MLGRAGIRSRRENRTALSFKVGDTNLIYETFEPGEGYARILCVYTLNSSVEPASLALIANGLNYDIRAVKTVIDPSTGGVTFAIEQLFNSVDALAAQFHYAINLLMAARKAFFERANQLASMY